MPKKAAGSRPAVVRRTGAIPALLATALAGSPLGCDGSSDPEQLPPDEHSATVDSAAHQPSTADPIDASIEQLVDYAAQHRASLDFGHLPPWSTRSGADPSILRADQGRVLGLTRRGQLMVLDAQAQTVTAVQTLPGATALRRAGDTWIVAAEGRGELHILDADDLTERGRIDIAGVDSIRDVAYGAEGRLYLADPHRHRLLRLDWPPHTDETIETIETCEGAVEVVRHDRWLVANCLLGHRLVLRSVDEDGRLGPAATIEHDGPLWSFDVASTDDGDLWVLAGGVEDHPLDRRDGAFGYIDSFAFTYRATDTADGPIVERMQEFNVSEHGVITPKHVRWQDASKTALKTAVITGYGSDIALTIRWDGRVGPSIERHRVLPGVTDLVGTPHDGLWASPLLDAWIVTTPGQPVRVVPVPDDRDDRSPSERLGEALAFTGLMAPGATSQGRRSRFTCETCHFEGRTDGRVHWTGRKQVHAATKTLRGLLNNRPHFSRALDPTTAGMVHNEFRVASAGTGVDPWFTLSRSDAPWLDALGAPPDPLDPVTLRRALVDFIAAFTPEPNPAIRDQTELSAVQADGARLFEQHCESCHRARLISDDPESAVPPSAWAEHILSTSGGIVWGSEARAMTGVEPYVYPEGPRVPSLRRLWVKRPLLTNGSAPTVSAVLDGIRLQSDQIHGAGSGLPLTPAQHDALAAFLDLL